MLRQFLLLSGVVALMFVSLASVANTKTSQQFIGDLSERLQVTLTEAKKSKRLNNVEYIDQLIDQEIIPQVNLEALCKRIFREHWQEVLDNNKKQEAIDAVVVSLKRTYRLAVSAYNGEIIEVVESKQLKSYDIVRIKITTSGKNDHTIDFAVRQFDNVWKIFDFSVDGIGVSKTLYGSISQQIKSEGLDKTLNSLAQSNHDNASS
ncbi:MlaC/ttg2D family ABC transporter substrate-binding protein [Alkalimarinus sediminis]|uniref:ABC transporter substrate-binding protein n=1 Tax=Alkalimarinus sediminis TaxID=1632866 RepID=A0A9E8KQF5_9ALTE|nr:ABC transporter substrate-binding protein [Alkalimarinus sediminis]UZW76388.1 ABC transporter substrate-binding protein [Alkalimarinus sediminis]